MNETIENGVMSKDDIACVDRVNNDQRFKSNLIFLNDHNGLRPGEVHTILGPKGGGKSTLVRTIIIEILQNMKKIYCFLSEEETKLYKAPIYKLFKKIIGQRISDEKTIEEKTNGFMSRLLIESQFNLKKENKVLDNFINRLEFIIKEYDIQVVVIDNVTTSFLNRINISQQAEAIEKMKEVAVKYSIPIILVLHTSKGTDINKQMLEGDDVRGNATSVNIGSYNYLVQTYFRVKPIRAFVTTDKARYHQHANKKVYELYYDSEIQLYTGDRKSDYLEITKIIKEIKKQKGN